MPPDRLRPAIVALLLLAWISGPAQAAPPALPTHLPQYRLSIDLDTDQGTARVRQEATWTNPTKTPTDRLVFNAHARYVVPDAEVGFMAKMLEILRVSPSEGLGNKIPPCEVLEVALLPTPTRPGSPLTPLKFTFEGDTSTTLVVTLPAAVAPGQSVTVVLDLLVRLPKKQGRWGQWKGVTTLSNWLPVFAYYGESRFGQKARDEPCGPATWQPVPFVPWHQPFFNEAGIYDVQLTLPHDQEVATTGTVVETTHLPTKKKRLHIVARGVRDYALLCSARYKHFEAECPAGPGGAPVRVHVLAFPEHEFYARHMLRIAAEALLATSRWLGPYPWPDFTIPEAFFGWNGNECSTLVMIDERLFSMPHLAVEYVEYLLSHEVCHQWWYNLVGTNGFCETWMDEGMANYFSHRYLTLKRGKNNALLKYPKGLDWLPNIRRDDYRSSGLYGTLGRGEMGPTIQDMPAFGHMVNLFSMCYDKGGRLVGMIEERLGETAFFDFTRLIVRKYSYRILSVADFQRELEEYTGYSWKEFFRRWLYEKGLSDWAVEKVTVTTPPKCVSDEPCCCLLRKKLLWARGSRPDEDALPGGNVKLAVELHQRSEYDEPTTLGVSLQDGDGYVMRIPILPGVKERYRIEDPPARVTPLESGPKGGTRVLVEVVLPCEPKQVAVDPDQVLVDAEPANNYWHPPIRWRITPLYTFLEETDLTNAYDRWNVILGPWLFTPTYSSTWFTRSTMMGLRAGAYRTQQFSGGVYAGYRTTWRDVVAGVDGQWEHFPWPKTQVGFVAERRLAELNNGDTDAMRGVLWGRYVFTYGSSLYLPPIHFAEGFVQYSDNFLPFPTQTAVGGVRYDRTTTLGLHYRLNYLTPYWDPEGGFSVDTWYEGGVAQQPSTVGLHKLGGQFAMVKSGPGWLADTRFAVRAYAATAAPSRGEFFTMGGADLFRGFDLAQRQGSTVWVGSVEWRVPLARELSIDCLDHVVGLRNAYAALFYDVGDARTAGHSTGPVAHGVGLGLRLDVAWFSFVERTTLRLDVAKAVNLDTGVQVWVGLNHPF